MDFDPGVQPWQIPIFVMGALALPVALFWAFEYLRSKVPRRAGEGGAGEQHRANNTVRSDKARAVVFAVIAIGLAVVCGLALGSAFAEIVASLLSAISSLTSAALSFLSFILARRAQIGLEEARREQKAERQGKVAVEPDAKVN